MTFKILHITDLHINDPNGANELLRGAYYREYLLGLYAKIGELSSLPIDCVIATGDFVDKGIIANFSHVKDVLQYIAQSFNLKDENIAVCCGNHDIVRDVESQGLIKKSREAYANFSSNFANGKPLKSVDKAVLLKVSSNIYALMLDAAPEGVNVDMPGGMTKEDVDRITNELILDGGIHKDALLIVGAHYPSIQFPGSVDSYNETNWHQRHFWSAGIALYKRISSLRKNKGEKTLWLYGDTHSPDHIMLNNGNYHVATGRIGTSIVEESQLRRQAKLILIDGSFEQLPNVLTLEYEIPTHKAQAQFGQWSGALSPIRSVQKQESQALVPQQREPISVFDEETQRVIIDKIEEKGFYSLGRFHTSEDDISLAWISIGPLLNSKGILSSVISGMCHWIEKTLGSEVDFSRDVVILGIDCWGAVLASELSIMTGAKNFCVAARGRGKYHTSGELINDVIAGKIAAHKIVIFISDVLATGHSIKFVYDKIQEFWKSKKRSPEIRWLCLSILMDENNKKRVDCHFIEAYGTACKSLRMPVVAKNDLPNETILPSTISFS